MFLDPKTCKGKHNSSPSHVPTPPQDSLGLSPDLCGCVGRHVSVTLITARTFQCPGLPKVWTAELQARLLQDVGRDFLLAKTSYISLGGQGKKSQGKCLTWVEYVKRMICSYLPLFAVSLHYLLTCSSICSS